MRPEHSPVFSPTPQSRPTGSGSRKAEHPAGGHHEHAVGLAPVARRAWPRTSWARRPPSTSRPPRARPSARILRGDRRAAHRTAASAPADVQERLVERDRLHQRRERRAAPRGTGSSAPGRRRSRAARTPRRDTAAGRAPWASPSARRTPAPRRRRERHDPAAAHAAHDHRLARRARVLQHLDRGVERVQVDVQDRLGRSAPVIACRAPHGVHHPAEPGLACQSVRGPVPARGSRGRRDRRSASRSRPSRPRAMQRRQVPDVLGDDAHPTHAGSPQLARPPPARTRGTRSSRPSAAPTRTP